MDSVSICGHQMDTEFGFYLPEYDDVSPEVQFNFVRILGMSGSLDLTEQDGMVYFDDIETELVLEKVTKETTQADIKSTARMLNNALLAEVGNVIFDDDPDFYRYGRVMSVKVECEDNGKLIATIALRLKPYRYKIEQTIVTKTISGSGSVTLSNLKMPVAPTVTVDSDMTLAYTIRGAQSTVTINEGSHIIDTLVLFEGDTTISLTGTGTITFSYREGSR